MRCALLIEMNIDKLSLMERPSNVLTCTRSNDRAAFVQSDYVQDTRSRSTCMSVEGGSN